MLTKAVLDDPVSARSAQGVGVLKKEDAIRYAVTGPTAGAAGSRRTSGMTVWPMPIWTGRSSVNRRDVFAKAVVRLLETFESIKMVRQALAKLPKGPVAVEVKEIPPGEGCGHAEAPRGETFHYVRSDGGNRPVRHKIRAPSYVNVPSFKASCLGADIADVTLTLAAVDPCYSCTERLAVVDGHSAVIRNHEELLRLSREKTARIRREIGAPPMKWEDV
jgi:NADH-quinone oxidoreductase subunit D